MPTPTVFTRRQKWRMAGVIAGGVLIHLSLGTLYTFGNISPYLTSYMRKHGSPSLTYTQCSWVYALALMGQGFSMTFGGMLEQRVGLRIATLLGCWLMSLGVFLTYFTVQYSFAGVIVTYGLMFGLGTGLAYALPLSCAMKWMPERKGLMNGVIVAGFGGGAFIFNQVQRAYINPNDLAASSEVNGAKYFTQDSVLNKVPHMFLILGGCYAIMQLIGCLLLSNPPWLKVNGDPFQYEQHTEEDNEERPFCCQSKNTVNEMSQGKKSVHAAVGHGDLKPLEMVRTKHFYFIFFSFFFMGQGIVFVSTLYKAFGLTFISDDTFLSLVGTFAAIFNALGRICFGMLADRFSYKVAAMIMTCLFTCLMLTFQLTKLGGPALFFIYVCLLFGCFSGSFSLFPTVTAKCFGQKNMARNYGIVFWSQIIAAPIGVFASSKLQAAIGWPGLFFVVAGSSFIAFIISIAFDAKDKNGKDI